MKAVLFCLAFGCVAAYPKDIVKLAESIPDLRTFSRAVYYGHLDTDLSSYGGGDWENTFAVFAPTNLQRIAFCNNDNNNRTCRTGVNMACTKTMPWIRFSS
jgi:hypothetical protein